MLFLLAINMDMAKMVISVSNTSESRSIRDSSFDTGSFSVTDIMIGSTMAMKNTYKRE
jgi:hypothetical protein